jgi:hypothetical protein
VSSALESEVGTRGGDDEKEEMDECEDKETSRTSIVGAVDWRDNVCEFDGDVLGCDGGGVLTYLVSKGLPVERVSWRKGDSLSEINLSMASSCDC